MEIQHKKLLGDNKYNPIEEQLFLRPISKKTASFLQKYTRISPDQVSLFGFLLTIATVFLIITKSHQIIKIIILLFASIILDKVDGDLARIKNIAGPKGQYIDGFLDILGEILLISAWAVAFSGNVPIFLVFISIAATALFNYHGVAAPLYLETTPNTHKQNNQLSTFNKIAMSLGYGRAKLFFSMIITILLQIPEILFILLPLLIIYTFLLYGRNIFIKKLTQR